MNDIVEWFARHDSGSVEKVAPLFYEWCMQQESLADGRALKWVASGHGYDRCLLHRVEPHFDIVALRWPPFVQSQIHDHAERGCVQVIMDGTLEERRYVPACGPSSAGRFVFLGATLLQAGSPAFIAGSLHTIRNPTYATVFSVHLYSPSGFFTKYFEHNTGKMITENESGGNKTKCSR